MIGKSQHHEGRCPNSQGQCNTLLLYISVGNMPHPVVTAPSCCITYLQPHPIVASIFFRTQLQPLPVVSAIPHPVVATTNCCRTQLQQYPVGSAPSCNRTQLQPHPVVASPSYSRAQLMPHPVTPTRIVVATPSCCGTQLQPHPVTVQPHPVRATLICSHTHCCHTQLQPHQIRPSRGRGQKMLTPSKQDRN